MSAIFGHVFAVFGCLIDPLVAKTGGHKLWFEWGYIKIGQEFTSEMSK